jgi:hypothetical protein
MSREVILEKRSPDEYERCIVEINSILRKRWAISEQAQDNKEKIQALSLAKECYFMKLNPLTNATVVNQQRMRIL